MSNVFDQFDATPARKGNLFDQFDAGKTAEPRSLLKEVPIQIYAGTTIDFPKEVGQAMQWMSKPGNWAYDHGKALQDWSEGREAENPDLAPQTEGRGLIGKALTTGARALVPSAAIMLPAAAGAVAAPALGATAIMGAGAGAATGAFGLFGAAQAQETYDKLLKNNVPEPEARKAGWINLMIEGGGETLGDIAGLKLFGMAGKALTKAATPVAGAIAKATDTAVIAPFLKQIPKTAGTEIATEFGQNFGEAWVENRYGGPNPEQNDPLHQGLEGATSALGMTLLLAPFGLAGFAARAKKNEKIATALQDPEAPLSDRLAASKILFNEIKEVNPEAAKAWAQNTSFAIATNKPILLDETTTEQRGTPTEQAIAEAEQRIGTVLAAQTPDEAIQNAMAATKAIDLTAATRDTIDFNLAGREILDRAEKQRDEEIFTLQSALQRHLDSGLNTPMAATYEQALRTKLANLGVDIEETEAPAKPAEPVPDAPWMETNATYGPRIVPRGAIDTIIPVTPEELEASTTEHLATAFRLSRSDEIRANIASELLRRDGNGNRNNDEANSGSGQPTPGPNINLGRIDPGNAHLGNAPRDGRGPDKSGAEAAQTNVGGIAGQSAGRVYANADQQSSLGYPANGDGRNTEGNAGVVDQRSIGTPGQNATNKPIQTTAENINVGGINDLSGEVSRETAAAAPPPPAAPVKPAGPVLQNRNRSSVSSVTQMTAIAANPDPARLSFSRDFLSGAPTIIPDGAQIPNERLGQKEKIVTAGGREIPVQYAIVEADQLLPSHAVDGSPNAGYDTGTVGRLRVVAGNGRAAGIQGAYANGTPQRYIDGIKADARLHGIAPETIAALDRPVLVRIMADSDVTENLGDETNIAAGAELSPAEKAANDARRIDIGAITFGENGEITRESARQFVEAMPATERAGLIDAHGEPTRQAYDRLTSAAFMEAYGDPDLVALQAQATDTEARTVMAAMVRAASAMARLADAGDLDIRSIVVEAAKSVVNAKRAGVAVQKFAAQTDLDMHPESAAVLKFFAENIRSAAKIGDGLIRAATTAAEQAGLPAEDMFGAVPKMSRTQILGKLNDTEGQADLGRQGGAVSSGQHAGGQAANRPEQGSGGGAAQVRPAEGAAAAEEVAPLELQGETQAELDARKAEEEAKAKADKAEQDRLDAAEKADREKKEVRQRSEAAAANFQLGQSAEDNLTGQGSIFDQPASQMSAPDLLRAAAAKMEEGAKPTGTSVATPKQSTELTAPKWMPTRRKPDTIYMLGADWSGRDRQEAMENTPIKGDLIETLRAFDQENPDFHAQVIIATDGQGNPWKVISANHAHIHDYGTPEANYTMGDVDAFRKDAAKRIETAREEGDPDKINAAADERITALEKDIEETKAGIAKNLANFTADKEKQNAGAKIADVDDRFRTWKEYFDNAQRILDAQHANLKQEQDELRQWQSQRVGDVAGPLLLTSEEVASEPATHTIEALNQVLTAADKRAAAKELGEPKWTEASAKKFLERYADWLQRGANNLGTKLHKLFEKVLKAAQAGMLSIAVAFNFNVAEYAAPMQVHATQSLVRAAVANPKANFNGVTASADTHLVADWIVRSKQQDGKPFIIADKNHAMLYAFSTNGNLIAKAPALFGATKGDTLTEAQTKKSVDQSTAADKITEAGIFKAEPSTYEGAPSLQLKGYENSWLALHRVYLGTPAENRAGRLATETADDNRVSYGCINALPEFIDSVIGPHFADGGTVVVLPETKDAKSAFGIPDETFQTELIATTAGTNESATDLSWGSDKYAVGRSRNAPGSARRGSRAGRGNDEFDLTNPTPAELKQRAEAEAAATKEQKKRDMAATKGKKVTVDRVDMFNNQGSLFSRGAKPGDKDLIVQHNLTAGNLIHAYKMGGLPVPSLAITRIGHPMENFGEITLIGDVAMADPQGYAKTKVFGGDAYSPRYPTVKHQFKNEKKLDAVRVELKAGEAATEAVNWDEVRDRGTDQLENEPAVMWTYLKSKGIEPEVAMVQQITPERVEYLRARGFEKFFNKNDGSYFDRQELQRDPEFQRLAIDESNRSWEALHPDAVDLNHYDFDALTPVEKIRLSSDLAYRMEEIGAPPKVNVAKTKDTMREQIKELGYGDFNAYAEELFEKAEPTGRIFLGFTYAGNRKYKAHTLDNVVAILKKELRGGENFNYGVGNLRAKVTPQFRSVAQIRAAKDRLVPKEQFEKIKKEIDDELMPIWNDLAQYHGSGKEFGFGDTVTGTLADSVTMGINRALKENGFDDRVPQELKQEMADFLNKLRNLPTEYFEAKITRAVDLAEFKGAVVPKGITQKVFDILKARGLDVETYDRADPKDRARAIRDLTARNPDNTMFSRADIFYSALSRAIDGIGMKSAPASGWKSYIRGQVNKGTIKQAELDATGIEDWLDIAEGKVTKEQVQDYLKANGVRVEEVMRGGDARLAELQSMSDDNFANLYETMFGANLDEDVGVSWRNNRRALIDEVLEAEERGDALSETKFSQYQLPGGQNYRELLLTLPERDSKPSFEDWTAKYLGGGEYQVVDWKGDGRGNVRLKSGASDQDVFNAWWDGPAGHAARQLSGVGMNFQSDHFPQKNILAHIRFNERTDAEGKKVLFIEEFQSDWAQKGKKEGFAGDWTADKQERMVAARKALESALKKNDYLGFDDLGQARGALMQHTDYAQRWDLNADTRAAADEYLPLQKEYMRSKNAIPSAPFVGKTDAWVALAMKRMVAYAAQNGFDKIAWTTGEQQAARYKLSNTVDAIDVAGRTDARTGEKSKSVALTLKNGSRVQLGVDPKGIVDNVNGTLPGGKVIGKPLEEVIGKDMAEKIMGAQSGARFEGVELDVGGKGMAGFYDKIVPSVANDVLKKLGGGQVSMINMVKTPVQEGWTYKRNHAGTYDIIEPSGQLAEIVFTEADARNAVSEFAAGEMASMGAAGQTHGDRPKEQQGFDITPAMREKVVSGLPLFNREQGGTGSGAMVRAALQDAIANTKISVTVHDTIEQAREATGVDIPDDAKAMYHGDEIHLFAENLADALEAEVAFWHEVQHAGINHLYGIGSREYDQALTKIAGQNKNVRAEAAEWRRKYGEDALARAKDRRMTDAEAQRYVTLQSYDEALAELASRNQTISGLKQFLATVQNLLRKIGLDHLADLMEGKTEAEALMLVGRSREAVMKKGAHIGTASMEAYHRAWHGSPHDFDEFKLQHIGSGEGAQAYGWGMYFAGKKEVADYYKNTLTRDPRDSVNAVVRALTRVHDQRGNITPDEAYFEMARHPELKEFRNSSEIKRLIVDIAQGTAEDGAVSLAAMSSLKQLDRILPPAPKGKLYEVELAPKEEDYIDWDKPLRNQTGKIRAVLRKYGVRPDLDQPGYAAYQGLVRKAERIENSDIGLNDLDGLGELGGIYDVDVMPEEPGGYDEKDLARIQADFAPHRTDMTPQEWLKVLSYTEGDPVKIASTLFNEGGVPGIRYLDGTSRDTGDGTHNYVIFDDKHVKIEAKYSRGDQTQTAAFKAWFKDSKVVDENGKPLVVYHGTNKSFDKFKGGRAIWFAETPAGAEPFTKGGRRGQSKKGANIVPAYVRLINPLRLSSVSVDDQVTARELLEKAGLTTGEIDSAFQESKRLADIRFGTSRRTDETGLVTFADWLEPGYENKPQRGRAYSIFDSEEMVAALRDAGYDGVQIKEDGKPVLAAFSPEQVKSATGNRGTFDPTNPDIRFSRPMDAIVTSPKVSGLIDGLMNSPSSLGVFNGVNTQYHKAAMLARQGKPQFKAVFDKLQLYLNDINAIAVRAEQQAPAIFRELTGLGPKSVTSYFKGAASEADINSIGPWLYHGTLYGGGNPLQGRVWTNEQLKGNFELGTADPRLPPLTDRQIELYKQARAAIDQSLEDNAKAVIHRHVGKLGITFDRDMSLEDVVAVVQEQLDAKIEDEQAHIDALNDQINDPETEFGDEDPVEAVKRRRELVAKGEQEIENLEALKETVDGIEEKAKGLIKHGYMPLQRFGNRTVTARDDKGKVQFFGTYDGTPLVPGSANAEMLRVAAAVRELHPEWDVTTGIKSEKAWQLYNGLNLEALQNFLEFLDPETKAALEQEATIQEYLRNAVNNRSVLKRMIHRSGMPGFSKDVPRGLAAFITSNARNSAGLYHITEAKQLVEDIPARQGDVKDEATELVKYVTEPGEEAAKLRGFLFFHFLGGSVAAAVVNLTQTVMMTLPYLAQFGTVKNVTAAAIRASKQAVMDPMNIEGEAGKMLQKAERDGITAPQQIHHLTATASNNPFSSNRQFRTFMSAWGGLFSAAEVFNRRVAFLAAYEIGKAKKMTSKQAYDFATKTVVETQGLYNKGNRPNLSRGTVGALVFTFKTFSIMYLELLRRLPPQQQLLMLGVLMVAAGAEGVPFAEDIEDLVDTLGQWLGFTTNTGKWTGKKVRDTLGKDWERPILKGLGGMLPIDLHSRIGMQNLLPGTAFLKPSEIDKTRDVAEAVGPLGGVLQSMSQALQLLARGKFDQAAVSMAPKAARDAYNGFQMGLTGNSKDSQGRIALKDVGAGEALGKTIGFNPQRAAAESETKREIMMDRNLRTVRMDEIASDLADAIVRKDAEDRRDALVKYQDWNKNNPELQIDQGQLMRSVRERVKAASQSSSERFLKSVPKPMKPEAREALRP